MLTVLLSLPGNPDSGTSLQRLCRHSLEPRASLALGTKAWGSWESPSHPFRTSGNQGVAASPESCLLSAGRGERLSVSI